MSKKTAIIGAGIVGLMTAYTLAKKGYTVTLYEANNKAGEGASTHNAGVIHVLQPPPWKWKSRLTKNAYKLYDELSRELDFPILETRTHLVYGGSWEKMIAVSIAVALKMLGYKVGLTNRSQLKEDCPVISRQIEGAVTVWNYRTVNPSNIIAILVDKLEDLGVEIHYNSPVRRVEEKTNHITVYPESAGGSDYEYVIVAAGPGSGSLAQNLGLRKVKTGYFKGVMVWTDLSCEAIIAGLRQPSRTGKTKGGAIIPWPDGRVLMGPSFQETDNPYDTSFTDEDLENTANNYKWILREEPVIKGGFAGTRTKNLEKDDFDVQYTRRAIVFQGIDSPGFSTAPLLARLVYEWVMRND
ncbi:MAG: FAD-binding oxidoreductase [Desulfurococcales archaeon]|nr:FAD-binding oxidoreductase [Desulfurococcales archaeon]